MRVLEVAAGFQRGHVHATGRRVNFHGLGVGTPILQPLLALLGDRKTYIASDSTSPIVDGWTSPTISLYVLLPAPMKLKAHRIAEHWLDGGPGWTCSCPYCRAFNRSDPPRIEDARQWWRSEGKPPLKRRHLHYGQPLSEFLPLLSNSAEPDRRHRAAMARVGHNHWVMQKLQKEIHRHSKTVESLRQWVATIMTAYQSSPAGSAWKAAAMEAWRIAETTAQNLSTADSAAPFGRHERD